MKLSKYNYFIEKNGKIICYNTLQDTMLVFSDKAYQLLSDSLDEFRQRYPKNYDTMVEEKVLIDDDVDELAEVRLRNKREAWLNRKLDLTVYPLWIVTCAAGIVLRIMCPKAV